MSIIRDLDNFFKWREIKSFGTGSLKEDWKFKNIQICKVEREK